MPRWIRAYWSEDDTTFLWEISDTGWVTRSIELAGASRVPRAAASLAEVVHARETGGLPGVQAYEAKYGVVPEKPIDEWDFPHEDIDPRAFELLWRTSRRALDQ